MLKKYLKKYKVLPIEIRASFWFFVCAFFQKGISVITTPIFTRLLTTTEYGQYSVFNSWLGILSIFVTLKLYYGVYEQGLIKFDEDQAVFSSSLQGLTLLMVSSWVTIYALFHGFWNSFLSLTTVQILAMLLMIWTTAVFSFWASEQRVHINYRKLVLLTILVSLAKPIIGIIFVINAKDKVTARILGLAFVELAAYSGLFIVQMKRGKKFFSLKYWKYAVLFNLPLIPHYLSQTVLSSADRIMINKMVNEDAAGIYSLAYSVAMVMMLFNTALAQTVSPWMLKKIKNKRTQDISGIIYIALIIAAAANLVLIALAPEAVALFAPSSYRNAIWVIPPVAMSVYFMFAYEIFSNFEFYFEKTKFIMTASFIAAVVNVILNYIFIGIFGYYAAGYTTLICYIIYTFAHYLCMQKICKEHMEGKKVFKPQILAVISVSFVMIGFVFLFLYDYIVARYASIGLISVVVFKQLERKKKEAERNMRKPRQESRDGE